MSVPKHVEELLEDLAESLQVPESHQTAAERSYHSVGEWLNREDSLIKSANPQVYVQGSFQLGTAIKPPSGEDYDLDLVCELSMSKTTTTQAELKRLLGVELAAYAVRHDMKRPREGRRCWTQDYADGANFHMDTLPAIPDAVAQRISLQQRGFSTAWSDTAIAITDKDHPHFRIRSSNWPHSNPKGYSNWFRARMQVVFDKRRRALALQARAGVETIPDYKVRTPLQSAIQILKHHRDNMFVDDPDNKPISIIITTLAAHAYQQDDTISAALYTILNGMEAHIKTRGRVKWIENPTDPAENFADRWQQYPAREAAFYKWLRQAQADFATAAKAASRSAADLALTPRMGKALIEAATARRTGRPTSSSLAKLLGKVTTIATASHRQLPPWKATNNGTVRIAKATAQVNGFRPFTFESDDSTLPKDTKLTFEAVTSVPAPYDTYWQVVNTGEEAIRSGQLRGGFDQAYISSGPITRKETALYRGTHSIECFIVKNGYLAANSGPFLVNVR